MLNINAKLRNIPAIDKLLAMAKSRDYLAEFPQESIVGALRNAVDNARQELKLGNEFDITPEGIVAQATQIIVNREKSSLQRVVNATGVVLHTNLGRAPLSDRAASAVNKVMIGYSSLEYNVADGQRGTRYSHIADRIARLVGAQDAIVVNNNAAAVLLVLSTLARGREVIVSRGQLVEIGGSFRVPDVMRQSGAILVEVGTTNKTHIADYENAISDNTGAILKVHTSNYRIVGFTDQPDDVKLKQLAIRRNVPLLEDLGSGTLLPLSVKDWHEPSVAERLEKGIDIVTFSGDKLLGAGQGGIIAGKKEYIDKMKNHPLLRAIRIDKLSLAALEGTLIDYEIGNAEQTIPVQRYLRMSYDKLAEKAAKLKQDLVFLPKNDWICETVNIESQAGGGSLPGVGMASVGFAIKPTSISTAQLEKRLRGYTVPIIVRVQNDSVIIDVRCLEDGDMLIISQAFKAIVEGVS